MQFPFILENVYDSTAFLRYLQGMYDVTAFSEYLQTAPFWSTFIRIIVIYFICFELVVLILRRLMLFMEVCLPFLAIICAFPVAIWVAKTWG